MSQLPRVSDAERSGSPPDATNAALPAVDEAAQADAAPSPPPERRRQRPRTFEALRDRTFRLFFITTLAQFWGLQAQQLARGYLVYDLTGSYAALGMVALLGALPNLVFALFGGVLADRLSKLRLLQVGQTLNAIIALSVGVLLATGTLRVEHLMIAAVVQGVGMSISMPARQAIIPEFVTPDRLTNAVSLNAAGMSSMRLVAPGIAGLVIALLGATTLYFLMSAMFILAVAVLAQIPYRHVPRDNPSPWSHAGAEMRDGVRYVRATPAVSLVLLINFAMVIFAMPLLQLIPGFAKDVLDAGPGRLGILVSVMGIGSLVGAMSIASLPDRRRGFLLIMSSVMLGAALLAFSLSTAYWLSLVLIVFFGVGHAGRLTLANVLLLAYTDAEYRGRVMSLYMMQFGVSQLGVFLIALLAAGAGARFAFALSAVLLLIVSIAAYLFLPRLRHLQ